MKEKKCLFGGFQMTWMRVIVLAVICAVMTALFLIVPAFRDTSFERMGVYLEAWFLPAIFIMSNCKTPLESALKTFVFFLVSQPLIYLLQVPFSAMGWGLFRYYGYWFLITLATFPMAYIGWYIRKKNWLSVLILLPVLAFLAITAYGCAKTAFTHFPKLLIAALFCVGQIILYVWAFFPDGKMKILGAAIPLMSVLVFSLVTPSVEVSTMALLPEDLVLSEKAEIVMEEEEGIPIEIRSTGDERIVLINAKALGERDFEIRDGDKTYQLRVRVYEDSSGHIQAEIVKR